MLNGEEKKKKRAAKKAIEYVKDGMVLGLGSGSTVYWALRLMGEEIKKGMSVKGVSTSQLTDRWADEFGIELLNISEVTQVDLMIDGADEVDQDFNMIKGGGGCLFREKMVAEIANKIIIVAAEEKMVDTLGKFPLPIEVEPFGWDHTFRRLALKGCAPKLRMKDGHIYTTDNGNYIVDCDFGTIENPSQMHREIKEMLGVVETGLFINSVDLLIIGKQRGVEEKRNNKKERLA